MDEKKVEKNVLKGAKLLLTEKVSNLLGVQNPCYKGKE